METVCGGIETTIKRTHPTIRASREDRPPRRSGNQPASAEVIEGRCSFKLLPVRARAGFGGANHTTTIPPKSCFGYGISIFLYTQALFDNKDHRGHAISTEQATRGYRLSR